MNSRLALRNIEKDWKVPPIAYRLSPGGKPSTSSTSGSPAPQAEIFYNDLSTQKS
ncbi:hypothetical protein P3T25_008757 [Paraburkholderia sp. GAS32]